MKRRINAAFLQALLERGLSALTVLELTEWVRLSWPVKTPSHEELAALGVSPMSVYRAVRNSDEYRPVFKRYPDLPGTVPAFMPREV